jgi:hypothetical protein
VNPVAILGLIGDLYARIGVLEAENAQLREAADTAAQPPGGP